MLQVLAILTLLGAVMINTQDVPKRHVGILRFDSDSDGVGGYNYAYENEDGTAAQEQGHQKTEESPTAQGSFAFIAPDGQQYSISYTADENGFQPQGVHIPTPPPIPIQILKALEQNKADEERGVFDDGKYHPEQYNNHV